MRSPETDEAIDRLVQQVNDVLDAAVLGPFGEQDPQMTLEERVSAARYAAEFPQDWIKMFWCAKGPVNGQ